MTDKERFEELAYNVGISLDGEKAIMSSDDYDFLYNYALQQAERVEELEKLSLSLGSKNQRYKQALERIAYDDEVLSNTDDIVIAREALEGEE